ncbi:MAG: hypothetical protein ABS873_08375 [Alkalibacterium sp.]
MSFYDRLKYFIKNHSRQSTEFLGAKAVRPSRQALSIQSKHYFQASELTSDQEMIDKIVKKIIRKDKSHRYYIGKQDDNIRLEDQEIYKYESLCSYDINIVPTAGGNLDLYVEGIRLVQIPESSTSDIRHYLQTTIMLAFAYIKGGPYKYCDLDTHEVREEVEPFDLSIYIQFS